MLSKKMAFANTRLQELRKHAGFSIPDCALLLSIPNDRYEYIESGQIHPNCAEIRELAKIFGVSTDYLLWMDLADERMDPKEQLKDREDDSFAVRLTRLMAYSGDDIKDIAALCKKKASSVYCWRRGRSTPDIDTLVLLAKHFGCSADYLLGCSTQRQKDDTSVS